MAGYRLEGPKAARMYEVILPKKLRYFGKIQEVLEGLFSEEAIRAVPFIRETLARNKRRDPAFDEQAYLTTLSHAPRGYSIYEMDGRYLSPTGPVDERVLVIRLIFHNPAESDSKIDYLGASLEVVNYLVARRFAEELGVEEEIWFVEYSNPQLAIWRKEPAEDPIR